MAIKCPKCLHENPDDTLFCGKCGTQFLSPKDADVTATLETPKEELPRGTALADRYEIIEELGKGGMGRVYRVEDTKLNQEVALKLIKPEIARDKKIIERFRNELKTTRMIAHKNVCRMFDLGEAEGVHFITMEYVRGEDLKSMIRMSGQLGIGTAVNIAKQVCEGLAESHRLGVLHRDLKPSNIRIDRDGNARIMDFGIARSLESEELTGTGVIIGTPKYVSPEQVEGKEIDRRSDIYSLGIILYEMVTGRVPFEGDLALSIAHKHRYEVPIEPKKINPQIPEDLNQVILKCLEKDRQKRFQSAGDVWDAFYHYWMGEVNRSLRALRMASEQAEHVDNKFGLAYSAWIEGWINYDRGNTEKYRDLILSWFERMLKHIQSYRPAPSEQLYSAERSFFLGLSDLKQGQIDSARSRLKEMESLMPKIDPVFRSRVADCDFKIFNAEVLLAEDSLDGAISVFEEEVLLEVPYMHSWLVLLYNTPHPRDVLARVYRKKGDLDRAILEYERLITFNPESKERRLIHPLFYYRLAKLYEEIDRGEKAIEHYEKFLDLWKDADPGIAEVEDARNRLAGLKGQ